MKLSHTGEAPVWTLADRLRKAREHARLTQQELADQIGISRASVVNYETGRHSPSRPVMLSWSLATGVDLGWLQGPPTLPGDAVSQQQEFPIRRRGIRKRGISAPGWAALHGLATSAALASCALPGAAS